MKEYKKLGFIAVFLIIYFLITNFISLQKISTQEIDEDLNDPNIKTELIYVDETNNALSNVAKKLDKGIYYVVDSGVSFLGKTFEVLFGI